LTRNPEVIENPGFPIKGFGNDEKIRCSTRLGYSNLGFYADIVINLNKSNDTKDIFSQKTEQDKDELIEELYLRIGQLKVKLDWLKK
jgi:hypothetical protein